MDKEYKRSMPNDSRIYTLSEGLNKPENVVVLQLTDKELSEKKDIGKLFPNCKLLDIVNSEDWVIYPPLHIIDEPSNDPKEFINQPKPNWENLNSFSNSLTQVDQWPTHAHDMGRWRRRRRAETAVKLLRGCL